MLPNANFGPLLNDKVPASTAEWVRSAFKGELDFVRTLPPQWMVNVQDTARLHVAALLAPELQNERILAFAQRYNLNDILAALRKAFPGRKFSEDDPEQKRDMIELDNSQGEEQLRAFARDGWIGLEESVRETCEGM